MSMENLDMGTSRSSLVDGGNCPARQTLALWEKLGILASPQLDTHILTTPFGEAGLPELAKHGQGCRGDHVLHLPIGFSPGLIVDCSHGCYSAETGGVKVERLCDVIRRNLVS